MVGRQEAGGGGFQATAPPLPLSCADGPDPDAQKAHERAAATEAVAEETARRERFRSPPRRSGATGPLLPVGGLTHWALGACPRIPGVPRELVQSNQIAMYPRVVFLHKSTPSSYNSLIDRCPVRSKETSLLAERDDTVDLANEQILRCGRFSTRCACLVCLLRRMGEGGRWSLRWNSCGNGRARRWRQQRQRAARLRHAAAPPDPAPGPGPSTPALTPPPPSHRVFRPLSRGQPWVACVGFWCQEREGLGCGFCVDVNV